MTFNKPYTGGELNWLNGRYGISAPDNSVPVMKLIRFHSPKTRSELYDLIRFHHESDCPCGIKSRGTVEDFGRNLFEAQRDAWGRCKYSLQACIQWEYDLFVSQSLKGRDLENQALAALQNTFPVLIFSEARGFLDETLRIDILIQHCNQVIGGIQVKPHSFTYMRRNVIRHHHHSNRQWGKPVFYLFYDEYERFINWAETTANIAFLIPS